MVVFVFLCFLFFNFLNYMVVRATTIREEISRALVRDQQIHTFHVPSSQTQCSD